MATLHTTAPVSMERFSSMISPTFVSTFSLKLSQRQRTFRIGCALLQQERQESRRSVSIALVLLHCVSLPKDAIAASIFDKYVKRKKLDPLETYVPAVILTELQIKELGKSLEVEQPKFADCRNLLRSGPAGSLRVNIRAVAQYALDDSNNKSAFTNVDQCLRSLEELDSLLLHASRNEPDASIKSMKAEIETALEALDSLLKTVPSDILEKGKAIADAYLTPEEEDNVSPEKLDPQLKQLESIL
ncbi:hypothetical protein M9H77_19466 [Catharanthus roseus]|uniref:Uncharacterized protein n=1 Tax=Catharanthus roseus TaxID=4058 RepID=A0ACC0BAH2_CATRO|nr:hypothetical protein M9H77_19466 [Catharanthus roseus]